MKRAWETRAPVRLSLSVASRERIDVVAHHLGITRHDAADALLRFADLDEAIRGVQQVQRDDQQARKS